MKRVISGIEGIGKYQLKEVYENFGIYQQYCYDCPVAEEFIITNGIETVVIESYNHISQMEILDIIDNYKQTWKYGLKMIDKGNGFYIVHFSGKLR